MKTTKTENYLREFYFIIFARRRIIVWTTILFFAASVLIAFLWPPTYSSFGSILVRGKKVEKSPEAIEEVEKRSFPLTKEDLASEVQILTSPDVIERTIKYLQDKNLYKKDIPLVDEVYSIQGRLKTEVIPASNVIEVTYYSKNPKDAVTILGALMDQYILFRMGVYNPSQAELFFSQQADQFKEGLEKNEKSLMALVGKTRIPDPQKEIEKNILIKKDLEQQLNILKSDAIEKKLSIQHLEKALRDKNIQYFSFIDNKPINDLSAKLQELFVERGKVLRAYNEMSDKVKLIDKQIDDTYALLKSEVNAYKENLSKLLKIINDKINSLENRLDSINTHNVKLQEQVVETHRIMRETRLQEFSYETFSKRREEARINTNVAASSLANVSILNKAFPSDGPVFPKPTIVIPLGLLIGFITGCTFGFLREFFDHTFKKPSDVYEYAGLPVIFSIPSMESRKPSVKLSIVFLLVTVLLLASHLKLPSMSTNNTGSSYDSLNSKSLHG